MIFFRHSRFPRDHVFPCSRIWANPSTICEAVRISTTTSSDFMDTAGEQGGIHLWPGNVENPSEFKFPFWLSCRQVLPTLQLT